VQLAALVVQLIAARGRRLFVALESWQLMAQDVQRGVWLVATVYPGVSLGSGFFILGVQRYYHMLLPVRLWSNPL